MVTTPNISICIPMYNASLYIKECIDSILTQSFQDFELLIVEDESQSIRETAGMLVDINYSVPHL